jgi:hypothetical protein
MSTPETESMTLKLRSIEVALDNFRARLQGSFSSQVSLLKGRIESINNKLASAASKAGATQANADLNAIIQETKGVLQKDLLHDTIELLNGKLTELDRLISRLKTLSTDQSLGERPPVVQQRILRKSLPGSLGHDTSEPDDDKDREIASLREEVNRLYNLTEREPRFQAFWILRDAYPSSVHITKIARTLNAMSSEVLENLKIFERLGLIEIKEGEARATKLVRPNKLGTEIA